MGYYDSDDRSNKLIKAIYMYEDLLKKAQTEEDKAIYQEKINSFRFELNCILSYDG